MYVQEVILRVTAVLCLAANSHSDDVASTPKRTSRIENYPQKVHTLFLNRYGKKSNHTEVWSAWGAWSECSRTCGGGVMVQMRYCINRPSDNRFIQKPRKRRLSTSKGCIGLYKKIHLCNDHACPIMRDIRKEQCSLYNQKRFRGVYHIWEPFLGANECALNCRPLGKNFYATLNKTVIDGTPCFRPMLSTGKPAPQGTRGICVASSCKAVNSRGVIGSIDESSSECPACSKGLCRSINGIYTRSNLPSGYSSIAQIPKGACRVLVQQMNHSKNFIALKDVNGTFIINGDWKFATTSRSFEGAGTRFSYVKQDSQSLESITSQGPLESSVDIYLVTYQPNLGIKYGYLLPNGIERQIAPPSIKRPYHSNNPIHDKRLATPTKSRSNNDINRIQDTRKHDRSLHSNQQDDPQQSTNHHRNRPRRIRRKFSWKISGISACSKSCGGGIQTTVVSCVREFTQITVSDKRCSHLEKPNANPIRCNIQDCPPKWSGYWSTCSVTCGSGFQKYITLCKQELNTGREIVVDDVQCSGRPKPLVKTQSCTQIACDLSNNEVPEVTPSFKNADSEKEWSVGDWSTCSVTCGTGYRSRTVTCPSDHCRADTRPSHAEYCTMSSCNNIQNQVLITSASQVTEISPWLVSEWSKCSEECGTGKQTRFAVCAKDSCDISSKPESTRDCSSDKQCGGQWFSGPWNECSDSCSGQAYQKREVICVVKLRGLSRITIDMTCPNHLKPPNVQPCNGKCDPFWFTGDWSTCDNCPNGFQKREVRCMDSNGVTSNKCLETKLPQAQQSCSCHRNKEGDKLRPAHDQPSNQSCQDKIRTCYLAVQARLCQYPYYKSQCCLACSKTQPDVPLKSVIV